jgi:O-acetylhomoserine (thiol)-lyase
VIRTFLDSGVLLAAVRSLGRDRERALRVLEDPNRTFLTSPFVAGGIGDDLIRLSVGLEEIDDILWDLDRGLRASA